jgi:hypothetical protein
MLRFFFNFAKKIFKIVVVFLLKPLLKSAKLDHNIWLLRKTPIFSPKISKIAEISEHWPPVRGATRVRLLAYECLPSYETFHPG